MADTLTANGHDNGSNGPPADSLTEEEFLAFFQEREEVKSDLAEALAACKAPRKALKNVEKRIGERMNLDAFLRAMEDRLKPGFQREEEDAAYRKMMSFLGKPVGTQESFDFSPKEAGTAELHQIDSEGYEAGRNGHAADTNSWTPGTARYERFATAHTRGFAEFMTEQTERAAALGSDEPKRAGRPRGAGKKVGAADGRRGRVLTPEHKAAMQAGRERKRAQAEAAGKL